MVIALKTGNPITDMLASSKGPNEMPHYCGISSGSALFAKPKSIFREFFLYYLETIICDLQYIQWTILTTVSNFMEYSIGPKMVNLGLCIIVKVLVSV